MRLQIAQIIICFGILLAFGYWIYMVRFQPIVKLRDKGKMAAGILTKCSRPTKAVIIDYSFLVDSIVYKGFHNNSDTRAEVGDSIRIMYLPSDPNVNAPAVDVLGKEYQDKSKYR